MDNKKFEIPKESLRLIDQIFEPLELALHHIVKPFELALHNFVEVHSPTISNVIREFEKCNVSSEVLRKAGWLPHDTMPFKDIAEWEDDNEDIQRQVLDYYEDKWKDIRSTMEERLLDYKVDEDAKAVFREALDAHESELYRLVCPALFSAIDRVLRAGQVGHINYKKLIGSLAEGGIEDFIYRGAFDLSIFPHLMKGLKLEKEEGKNGTPETEPDWPKSANSIIGIYKGFKEERDLHSLEQDPVPNRHAAIHGMVVYSSPQNSLNAIFLADYIYGIVTHSISVPSSPQ